MNLNALPYKTVTQAKNIFIPLFANAPLKKEEIFSHLPKDIQTLALEFAEKEFKGREQEIKSLWIGHDTQNRIVFFGLGERARWNERKTQLLPRRMVQYAKRERIESYAVSLGKMLDRNAERLIKIFFENSIMADFEFTKYKEKPKEGWPKIETIDFLCSEKINASIKKSVNEGTIIGEEVNGARELANTPGGDMTPTMLAHAAIASAKRTGMSCKILEEKDMQKMGMGGVLGVARGSDEKPKFIILEYWGKKKPAPRGRGSLKIKNFERPLILVGKGVTFDTGGLNLKPEQGIYEMHMDMTGGAAVIHGIAAVAQLKLSINIVGIIPAVENMPSGSSYHPGDLLKTMSGKTIEVLNTDAEGRVILSDALFYGTRYHPGLMVDFATLTGAAHVALGSYCSALFTNRDALIKKLVAIGEHSGDYVWPMPLWDEYMDDIKGTFGDLANTGKDRRGGAIHGAKFLEQFVAETPWAHLDIAPRMTSIESEFLAKGATGVGVRYIVELAKQFPKLI